MRELEKSRHPRAVDRPQEDWYPSSLLTKCRLGSANNHIVLWINRSARITACSYASRGARARGAAACRPRAVSAAHCPPR